MRVSNKIKQFKAKRKASRLNNSAFYRRYPYRGQLPLGNADARGLVDFELGIFFNRIRKAGNTTIVTNLAALKFNETRSGTDAKAAFLSPGRLDEKAVNHFEALYKFVFVRNPYTRTLSAYLDKIAKGKRKPSALVARSDPPPSFVSFCRYLADGGLFENGHWAPQSASLLIPADQFDFIGKLENFDADFRCVLDRITPAGSGHPVKTFASNRTGANERLKAYYTHEAAEIVARQFAEDFDVFGYSPHPDFL